MTPGPGDDRHKDDNTEEDQHQGNGDSEDNEDNNSRDDRNDGCKVLGQHYNQPKLHPKVY